MRAEVRAGSLPARPPAAVRRDHAGLGSACIAG